FATSSKVMKTRLPLHIDHKKLEYKLPPIPQTSNVGRGVRPTSFPRTSGTAFPHSYLRVGRGPRARRGRNDPHHFRKTSLPPQCTVCMRYPHFSSRMLLMERSTATGRISDLTFRQKPIATFALDARC